MQDGGIIPISRWIFTAIYICLEFSHLVRTPAITVMVVIGLSRRKLRGASGFSYTFYLEWVVPWHFCMRCNLADLIVTVAVIRGLNKVAYPTG